jgi:hypothetical protein
LNGKIGEEYTYCISNVLDPNDDKIYVLWEWGDGSNSDWEGPFESGENVCESHTWTKKGDYIVKVKLRDEYGEESDYGYLEINIPRYRNSNRLMINAWISNFLKMFPFLRIINNF